MDFERSWSNLAPPFFVATHTCVNGETVPTNTAAALTLSNVSHCFPMLKTLKMLIYAKADWVHITYHELNQIDLNNCRTIRTKHNQDKLRKIMIEK